MLIDDTASQHTWTKVEEKRIEEADPALIKGFED